jgi:low temperature requirement protein LtrA
MGNHFGNKNIYHRIFLWLTLGLVALMGISAENSFNDEYEENTGNRFIGPYLIFRYYCVSISNFKRVLNILYYVKAGLRDRRFLNFLFLYLLPEALIPLFPLFASLFIANEDYRILLWYLAFALELCVKFGILGISIAFELHKKIKHRMAYNIEHYSERFGLFTIIMIGEVCMGCSLFHSNTDCLWLPLEL